MTTTRKAILYCRCSTHGQAQDGQSIPYQGGQLRAWASLKGLEVAHIYKDEGISGFHMHNRPGLQEAIASCKKGDVFVVYSLSRFSRSVKDCMIQLDALAKKGVEFVSLSENLDGTTASGRAMIGVIAVFAQFFRDQISENTKAALRHKRSNGEKQGGKTPLGYNRISKGTRTDKHGREQTIWGLTANPQEQQTITSIRELSATGYSLRDICDYLNAQGIKTKTGKGKWSAGTIAGILKRTTDK